jgi:syntaxin-binding protein 1
MHEFTYQAMVYDLLEIKKDIYKYHTCAPLRSRSNFRRYVFENNARQEQTKEVMLGEADQLWPVLRHRHIADTINFVIENFNEFVRSNKAAAVQKKKDVSSLKEMGDAMRAMPQYQEMLNKYSLHIHMANQCMKVFKHRKLDLIGNLEQVLPVATSSLRRRDD